MGGWIEGIYRLHKVTRTLHARCNARTDIKPHVDMIGKRRPESMLIYQSSTALGTLLAGAARGHGPGYR